MKQDESNRVILFDTTLRDGEQSPGASMHLAEKLEIAHALSSLGVDVIEAGFPIASPGDFEAVQAIARQVEGPIICGLARCHPDDISRACEAIQDAPRRRLHLFLATSEIHRTYKLQMAKEAIIQQTVESIERAKALCDDVEFSPEDASRTEPEFLAEVVERAIAAGATTVNIPDTVGYALPDSYAALIRHLVETVRGIDAVTLSVHCHNDLGLAVANSLAALTAGARQVECTINGIGERAGNGSLEEIVMAMHTRADEIGLWTGIDTQRLYPTSRLVSNITGLTVQRNKAIVGQNAFAHEAGIHQHGMMMNPSTYEIMRPETVGFRNSQLVLGKHSGRHALQARTQELGYHLDPNEIKELFRQFKELADKKKEVYDADIEALIGGRMQEVSVAWTIESFHTSAGTGTLPTAAVRLRHSDGHEETEAACGDGPIDALFKSIERVTGIHLALQDYTVRSVTVGEDAQGEASVDALYDGERFHGRAVSTDIVEASAKAFLRIVNRVLSRPHSHDATDGTGAVG